MNQKEQKQQISKGKKKTSRTKKLREQKMVENNSKLLLSGKCDFDPEEILDKLLLFNLKKKQVKKKYLI